MLKREQSWAFYTDSDIWKARDTHTGLQYVLVPSIITNFSLLKAVLSRFINNVSGTVHFEEPQAFRGGIVADPMGLGKTLTMISLAATDLEPKQHENFPVADVLVEEGHNGATLIIVPPPRKRRWSHSLER